MNGRISIRKAPQFKGKPFVYQVRKNGRTIIQTHSKKRANEIVNAHKRLKKKRLRRRS